MLCPPLVHEETATTKPVVPVTGTGADPLSSWESYEIESHEKYLALQQASLRWRSAKGMIDIWTESSELFAYVDGAQHDAPVKSCTWFA
ncbi:hypothetical protein KCU77_g8311, partial [Aureobasidium melanogenum]